MTAFSYAHAGIGYPNGETPISLWTGMPGVDRGFLILDSEHWHVNEILERKPEGLHILRAMTGPLDNSRRIAARTLLHFDPWKNHPSVALQFRNEDNLNYERGDNRNDWDWGVMQDVYRKSSAMYREIAMYLVRDYGVTCPLVWPPYAPGHYLQEMADIWVPAAKQRWNTGEPVFRYIGVHQYGEANPILAEIEWFRETFPAEEGYEILLLEYHGDRWIGGGSWENTFRQERETLEGLAKEKVRAYFFIGKWVPPAENHSTDWDIEGNADRTSLFRSPPLVSPIEEKPMREPNHAEIFAAIAEVCEEMGIPLLPAFALAEAESSLIESFEKGTPPNIIRPLNENQYAAYWPDVSAGPFHQTVRWAPEYTSTGGGSSFPGVNRSREVLDLYRYDAKHAATIALGQLRGYLTARALERGVPVGELEFEDIAWALDRYNKPNGTPTAGVAKRYRDSLTKAIPFVKYLESGDMPEFHFGFKDLADKLGPTVVGEPVSDETYLSEDVSIQFTTTGMMMYTKSGNTPHFFEAIQPD
jgi:hypothetical protein